MLSVRNAPWGTLLASDDAEQAIFHIGPLLLYAPGAAGLACEISESISAFDSLEAVIDQAMRIDRSRTCRYFGADGEILPSPGAPPAPQALAAASQYGIAAHAGVKAIYSPDITLAFLPPEYKGWLGGISSEKRALNNRIYRALGTITDDALNELVQACAACDYGLLDTLELNLLHLKPLERAMPVKKRAEPRARDKAEIMIHYNALGTGIGGQRQRSEILASLSRKSGLHLIPFRYLAACYAECDAKDARRLVKRLQQALDDAYVWLAPVRSVPERAVTMHPVAPPETRIVLPNLEQIGIPAARTLSRGAGVRIGIIDTGIDYTHAELRERFDPRKLGYDFVRNNHDPDDLCGHGTHVAGTIAGQTTGVAPEARLYALRALNKYGQGSEVDILRAIEWAITENLDIINMSLGAPRSTPAEAEAISLARSYGLTIVAAAGNDGDKRYNYPAAYHEAIGVAAVDGKNNHASFSNYNDRVDISAPGIDILSCWPKGMYSILSGTSMAAPHVSGVAALVLSLHMLQPADIEKRLARTAESISADNDLARLFYGAGLVRADHALSMSAS